MFVALWEYEVKPGDEERFENAQGPDGDWVRLFRRDTHYHETRLVRDALRSGVYLTMDFWESRGAYEEFMAEHRAEYEEIDRASAGLTINERRIGWFELAAK
ncbi:MAG TPA: antibiotic biosynthesis monooxygenase [Candidatus Cybelea sp.]|nr:antibiotic biosynthesis monooxygenase [Candidatus Cybelea sp.]